MQQKLSHDQCSKFRELSIGQKVIARNECPGMSCLPGVGEKQVRPLPIMFKSSLVSVGTW